MITVNFKKAVDPKKCLEEILMIFGESATSLRTVQRYYKQLRTNGQISEARRKSGRPPLANKALILEAVNEDPSMSSKSIAKKTGFSSTTVKRHLKSSGQHSKLSTWTPHHLEPARLENHIFIQDKLLKRQESRDFLRRVVTADETWIC